MFISFYALINAKEKIFKIEDFDDLPFDLKINALFFNFIDPYF